MKNEDPSSTSTALIAFGGGLLLGAGLAMLLAPQSGRKTRRMIGGLAEDAEDFARDLADEAAESFKKARKEGERWIEEAKGFAEEKKAQLAAAVDGARRT